MIRIIAKLFAFAVALTASLPVGPLFATTPAVVWVSSTGSDSNPCTAAQPCTSLSAALSSVIAGGQVNCLNSPGPSAEGFMYGFSATLDCAGVYEVTAANFGAFVFNGNSQVMKIRNLTISGAAGGGPAIKVTGSGTLIIENCVFENLAGVALDIEPTGPFNLLITNSRISSSSGGVLIQPSSGGSVNATFDHVTITQNSGGGVKINTASGPVTVDMTASVITDNTGNGLNAVSGAGGAAMFSIGHSVIARNGSAGVQANGTNAAALIDTTLLDGNGTGALEAIGSGRILTYGNNRIVGSAGTGFTGPAALQ